MPGEVTLAHQVGKDFMPVTGGSQLAYVLLEAKPTEMMAQVRMPLNFALVLDHSGSMKGAKLRNVKEAVKMLIDRLEPTDYVSVVIFDDTAQVIIPSMPANDKPGMKAAIDQIRDAGGTTMSLGMIQGLNELRRWNIPNAINRMILLTDGVTYGDAQRCRQLASDAAAVGIGIYTLGIGSDWDEDLLDVVGQTSASRQPAEFIRDPSDALNVFQQQVQSAVNVALRNTNLILRLPVGVTPKKAVLVLPFIKDLGQGVLSDRHILIPLGRSGERQAPVRVDRIDARLTPGRSLPYRRGRADLRRANCRTGRRKCARRHQSQLHPGRGEGGSRQSRSDELRRKGQRAPPGHARTGRIQAHR